GFSSPRCASRVRRLSNLLLYNDRSRRDVLMKIVIEVVASWTQRRYAHSDCFARPHDLFAVELKTFELDGFLARICNPNRQSLVRRYRDRLRCEAAVLET